MSLRIFTLGLFRVQHGDIPITDSLWTTHKNKTLFKLLLTYRGHSLAKDQLIEWLWPDLSPRAAGRDLRVAVSQLRRVLEPQLSRGSQSSFILTTESGYAWNAQADYWLDVEEFAALCADFEVEHEVEVSQERIANALYLKALYQGDYLAGDLYADWASMERERLRELYFTLLMWLAEARARQGNYRRAIALCREVLVADHCRESVWHRLMLYHCYAGDQVLALRTYAECQRFLAEELGLLPLPEMTALADQIRQRAVARSRLYPPPAYLLDSKRPDDYSAQYQSWLVDDSS